MHVTDNDILVWITEVDKLLPSLDEKVWRRHSRRYIVEKAYLQGVTDTEAKWESVHRVSCGPAGCHCGLELSEERAKGERLVAALRPLLGWARSERVMRFGMASDPLAEDLFKKAEAALKSTPDPDKESHA